MADYVIRIIVNGEDRASRPLGAVGSALGNMAQIAGGILGAQMIQNVGRAVFDMGRQALDATASWERMGMSMQSMIAREMVNTGQMKDLASAMSAAGPKAEELLHWLEGLAINSPFDAEGVAQTYKMGLTFGFSSDKAKELTQILIDMSAGMGLSGYEMERVGYALGQINASDKLLMQDLRQLMSVGVPVNDILKKMGYSISDVGKEAIDSKEFIRVFNEEMGAGFKGAAAKQAKSWAGLLNSISDIKKIGLREFFSSTFDAIQPYIGKFVDKFSDPKFIESLRKWGEPLGKITGELVGIIEKIFGVEKAATDAGNAIRDKFNMKNLDKELTVGDKMKGAFSGFADIFKSVGTVAAAGLSSAFLLSVSASLAPGLVSLIPLIGSTFAGLLSSALGSTSVIGAITIGLSKLSPVVGGAFFKLFMVGGTFSKIGGAFSLVFGGLTKVIAPLLSVLAPVASGFASIVLPIIAVVGAAMLAYGIFQKWKSGELGETFAPIVAGIEKLKAVFEKMKPTLVGAWDKISSAFSKGASIISGKVIDFLVDKFGVLTAWFEENRPLIESFITVLADVFTNVIVPAVVGFWDVISPILGGVIDLILGLAKIIMQVVTGDWSGAWETAKKVVADVALAIWDALKALWQWIVDLFKSLYDVLVGHSIIPDMMDAIYKVIIEGLTNVISGAAAFVENMISWFSELAAVWSNNWEQLKEITAKVWEVIKAWVAEKIAAVKQTIVSALVGIVTTWSNNWNQLKEIVSKIWTLIKSTISDKIAQIKGMISSKVAEFKALGSNMIKGFEEGVKAAFKNLLSTLGDLVNQLPDVIKKALGMQSPSKVFAELGRNTMLGFTQGLVKTSALPISATLATASALRDTAASVTNTNQWNVTINNPQQTSRAVRDDIRTLQLLAGAA